MVSERKMKIELSLDLKRRLCLLYEFKLLYSYDGIKCKTCGFIQGLPNDELGIKKYYCEHYYNRVNRKMKPIRSKLFQDVIKEVEKELLSEFKQSLKEEEDRSFLGGYAELWNNPEDNSQTETNPKNGVSNLLPSVSGTFSKEDSEDICICGHHTKDHSYDPNKLDADLECDICDCKRFKTKEDRSFLGGYAEFWDNPEDDRWDKEEEKQDE